MTSNPKPLQIGDEADIAAARLLPVGALCVDAQCDPVLRTSDGWRRASVSIDETDGEWDESTGDDATDRMEDAAAWPLRLVALGCPDGLSVEEATRRVREFTMVRRRALGEQVVMGAQVPLRSLVRIVWSDDDSVEHYIRLPSGKGYSVPDTFFTTVDDLDRVAWKWDIAAPMRVIATDLTDEELVRLTDAEDPAEWAQTRRQPPGDEIALVNLPPGSIAVSSEDPNSFLARHRNGRGYWFERAGDFRKSIEARSAGWWTWDGYCKPRPTSRGRIIARDVDFDQIDAAKLAALLGEAPAAAPAAAAVAVGDGTIAADAAPCGWLLVPADPADRRAFVRFSDGRGERVRTPDESWCGLCGSRVWDALELGRLPLRVVAPLEGEPRWRGATDASENARWADISHKLRGVLWDVSPPKDDAATCAEALALAAGDLGPAARRRILHAVGIESLIAAVVPTGQATIGGKPCVAAWTPVGVWAETHDAPHLALLAAGLADHLRGCMQGNWLTIAALERLARLAPGRVLEWLAGHTRQVSAGPCALLAKNPDRNVAFVGDRTVGPHATRAGAAALLIDDLLDTAQTRSATSRCAAGPDWTTWIAVGHATGPRSCGPAVAAPGHVRAAAVARDDQATSSRADVSLAMAARLARKCSKPHQARVEADSPWTWPNLADDLRAAAHRARQARPRARQGA